MRSCLADPIAERLLDNAELSRDVGHGAFLVDDQGSCVPAELLWVPTSSPDRRRLLFGHCWHDYLLFEVSGQRGIVTARFSHS
jgi:hypothetical protein